jgi:hypothetical protein
VESVDQRIINLVGFAVIAASNGIDTIAQGAGWHDALLFCAPFLAFFLIQLIAKGRKGRAVLYLIIATALQFAADRGDFSATVFAMFAVSDWPKPRFAVASCVTLGVTAFVRFTLLDQTISDFLNIAVLYVLIGVTYYNKFYPKPFQPMAHPDHKPLDIKIMQLYVNGYTYKEIARDLRFYDLTEGAIASRIQEMRRRYGPNTTTAQLIGYLYNSSYIKTHDRNL